MGEHRRITAATLIIKPNGEPMIQIPNGKDTDPVPEYALFICACGALWTEPEERQRIIDTFLARHKPEAKP